ncbi:hypothetical protein D3C78_1374880 [compost metagenome]
MQLPQIGVAGQEDLVAGDPVAARGVYLDVPGVLAVVGDLRVLMDPGAGMQRRPGHAIGQFQWVERFDLREEQAAVVVRGAYGLADFLRADDFGIETDALPESGQIAGHGREVF